MDTPTASQQNSSDGSASLPPLMFYDAASVFSSPVTFPQVASFNPREKGAPSRTMQDGSEYYGDVLLDEPHGSGLMIFKSGTGPYGNGDRYGGGWKNGQFHGDGVLITSAFTYQGGWFEGKMHGRGKMNYSRSVADIVLRGISVFSPFDRTHAPLEYIGDFHQIHCRHGRGMMRYENGDVYEGEWASNRRHGQGQFTCANGETYYGQWNKDERHGYGKIQYVDGGEFKGMMVHDRRHGEGVMLFPNGDEYYGSFSNNQICGRGTMRYKNGDVYDGMWKDGLRYGEGKYTLRKQGATVEGCFVNGLIQGRGILQHPGVSTFVGEFDRGERKIGTLFWHDTAPGVKSCYQGEWLGEVMHGNGLLWYRNGDFYFGKFVKNLRSGQGNMRYTDGSEYSGGFFADMREGLGILQLSNGSIRSGVWLNDVFVEGYEGEWDGNAFNGIGRLLIKNPKGFGNVGQGGKGSNTNNHGNINSNHVNNNMSGGGNVRVTAAVSTPDTGMGTQQIEHFGLFRNGVRHGTGILKMPGHVIMGQWEEDMLTCEKGSWTFPSGELYVGGFSNGLRDGPDGQIWLADDSYFIGQWQLDAPQGPGTLYAKDQKRPIYAAIEKDGEDQKKGTNVGDNEGHEEEGNNATGGGFGVMSLVLNLFRRKADASDKEVRRIVGFEDHYVMKGTWEGTSMPYNVYTSFIGSVPSPVHNRTPATVQVGTQEGQGCILFKSGVCLRMEWLHNHPRLMLPHRPDAPLYTKIYGTRSANFVSEQKSCLFCTKPFAFYRKETVCTLCQRCSCSSCLHPIDVQGYPRIEALVRKNMNLRVGSSGVPSQVPVCGDCARASLLGISFSTIWVPMDYFAEDGANDIEASPSELSHPPQPVVSTEVTSDAVSSSEVEKNAEESHTRGHCGDTNSLTMNMNSNSNKSSNVSHNNYTRALEFEYNFSSSTSTISAKTTTITTAANVLLASDAVSALPVAPDSVMFSASTSGYAAEDGKFFLAPLVTSPLPESPSVVDREESAQQEIAPSTPTAASMSTPLTTSHYVVYEGYTCRGIPHMYGSLWWGKEGYYLGGFDEGRRSGSGTQIMRNGERYVGQFKDDVWHGSGTYSAEDGSAYEGVWKGGKLKILLYHGEVDEHCRRHGRGQSYESDGARYNGEWLHGERHGTGILQDSKGVVYSGDFAFGRIEGEGKLVHEASVFYGSFLNGKKHGKGTERFGECVVEGEWRDEMLSGFVRIFDGLNEEVYETTYRDGNERDDCFVPPIMAGDEHYPKCAQCQSAFSLFMRRHHCRLCGEVVCDNCSQRRAVMPAHFKMDSQQRICDRCFQRLEQRRMLGIRRYGNGEVYAGCWSQGGWVARGLFRRHDGSVIVMDATGKPLTQSPPNPLPSEDSDSVHGGRAPCHTPTPTHWPVPSTPPMDAAPSREALRQLPPSSRADADAFAIWWSTLLAVAGLALPLDLAPTTHFVFPRPPPTKPLRLFSNADEAAAWRAARCVAFVSPNPPERPPQPRGRPPPRPSERETEAMARLREERLTGNAGNAGKGEMLPPTPFRPPRDTNARVPWEHWGTRTAPTYRRGEAPMEWAVVPFACPVVARVIEDADRAVRRREKGGVRWKCAPLAAPVVFVVKDTQEGVVVEQHSAV